MPFYARSTFAARYYENLSMTASRGLISLIEFPKSPDIILPSKQPTYHIALSLNSAFAPYIACNEKEDVRLGLADVEGLYGF